MNDPSNLPDLGDIAASMERTLANLQNHNRRGKSNWPYYKQVYADEVMRTIEDVLTTGQPQMWPATVVTASTLWAKWSQGCNWLRDNEPDSHELMDAVQATKLERVGLRITKRRGAHIPRHYAQVNWRPKFQAFLAESNHRDKLEIAVPLTVDDIAYINNMMAPVAHLFITSIDDEGLLLVRYDRDTTTGPTN
jgi:hypothetical protein